MTLEQLRKRQSEITAAQKKILDTAGNDALSDEQAEEFDTLQAEHAENAEKIKKLEADQARRAAVASRQTPEPRRAAAQQPAAATITNPTPVAEQRADRGFANPREFLHAVMQSSRRGATVDERLIALGIPAHDRQATAGSDEHSTFSDAYGGFLLPETMMPNLLQMSVESDPVSPLTTRIPMSTQIVRVNARVDKNHTTSVSGGLRVYRRAESDTIASSRMSLEQIKLEADELMGVAYASEELLAQSPMSFIAMLDAGFRDEFGAKIMLERLKGTGTGEYLGIHNSPALVTVSKETGQAAATIVKENIDKMRARCWRYGSAVWLYNHDCLPALRSLVQVIGTGGTTVPYFQTSTDGTSTLDGRPAYATEFAETLGTVGDLVLCNWSQFLEGTLTPLQSAESMHVRFLEHERTFKFFTSNAGAPWWRSALTPKKGANTISPFVVLATRS